MDLFGGVILFDDSITLKGASISDVELNRWWEAIRSKELVGCFAHTFFNRVIDLFSDVTQVVRSLVEDVLVVFDESIRVPGALFFFSAEYLCRDKQEVRGAKLGSVLSRRLDTEDEAARR